MARFLQRADLDAAGLPQAISDALAGSGFVTGSQVATQVNILLPTALADTLPTAVGPILPAYGVKKTLDSYRLAPDVDDTNALTRALADSATNQITIQGIPGKRYKLSGKVTVNTSNASFDGQGCAFVSDTYAGTLLEIVNTIIDAGGREADYRSGAARGGFRNFVLVGPGRNTAGTVGILFGNPSFGAQVSHFRIEECETAITFGSNSFCTVVSNFEINHCAHAIVYPSGLTNSGERITFSGFTIANCDDGMNISGGYVQCDNGSFDYMEGFQVKTAAGGHFFAKRCHFEQNYQDNWWIANNGTSINIDSCNIVVAGKSGLTRTIPIGFADFNTRSSINLSGTCTFSSVDFGWGDIPYMIEGYGTTCHVGNFNVSPTLLIPPTHSRRNLLSDGAFNVGNTRDFVNTSTAAANAVIATGALRLRASAAGDIVRVEKVLRVNPNSLVFLSGKFLKTASTADSFYVSFQWKNLDGNDMGSSVTRTIAPADIPTVSGLFRSMGGPAPIGSAFCRVTISRSNVAAEGASDAIGDINLDDLYLTSSDASAIPHKAAYTPFYTKRVTATTPINPDFTYYVDTTTAAISVTLPNTTAVVGTRVVFADAAGTFATNNLTIVPAGGRTIRGAAGNLVLNTNYQRVTLEWDGITWQYA